MHNKILNSILLITASILVSCNMSENPVNSAYSPDIVQIEEKWETDIFTSIRQNKIYYKEFDKNGNILLYVEFSKNSDTASKSIYTYEDNLSTEQHISFDDIGNIVENSKIKYFYSDSKLVEKKKYDDKGELQISWSYDYNNHGHLTETKQENIAQGTSLVKTYKNAYNNQGELTEISYDIKSNSPIDQNPDKITKDSIVYLPDNSIKYFKIDLNGEVNNIYSYIYDFEGKITAQIISDAKGTIKKRYDYYYSYFK